MTIVKPKRSLIPMLLLVFFVFLAVMHVLSVIWVNISPENNVAVNLARSFDLDNERNIPTVYSSLILGMCAFCCAALSFRCKSWINRLVYYIFGAFFFYVAFDESLIIHETSAEPIRELLGINQGSPLYHAWVIPAIIILAGLVLLYKFIRDKSKESKFQKKMVILVAILGAGVIFLEIIGTQIYVVPLAYKLGPVLVEELFEIGMVSYILAYLSNRLLLPANSRY